MTQLSSFFCQIKHHSTQSNHRFGVVLHGDPEWIHLCIDAACSSIDGATYKSAQLGGDTPFLSDANLIAFNKGQQLLGQEFDLLICDLSSGWDANSFNAAIGTLVGGGLLLVVPSREPSPSSAWVNQSLEKLISLHQHKDVPLLSFPPISLENELTFEQQNAAVAAVIKVVDGHRKRPLVLTADRGRGKSSALGIAAAKLMSSKTMNIAVTAPRRANVEPVFQHAADQLKSIHLKSESLKSTHITIDSFERNRLVFGGSTLTFVAPDELLRSETSYDLVLVDEAAAIPVSMLEAVVNRFHRAVFSSTIHGYEGCGRGFTLKFQSWLTKNRPGSQFLHLTQPIRWANQDPLEAWVNDSFLLNADLSAVSGQCDANSSFDVLTKQALLADKTKLADAFALMINAHYQTSPNDLMLLLDDANVHLYSFFHNGSCVACLWAVEEGNLNAELIAEIQRGTRRPKGHLAPVTLANLLGITQAAQQTSHRIMRIAVHPQLQGQGLGRRLLQQYQQSVECDYLSTSFGATSDLVSFWSSNGFKPAKLGNSRDHSSGCHSILMIKEVSPLAWSQLSESMFCYSFKASLGYDFSQLDVRLVQRLLSLCHCALPPKVPYQLIEHYAHGGATYESIEPWLVMLGDVHTESVALHSTALFVRKVLQRAEWGSCAKEFELAGRRAVEAQLRFDLIVLLENLHCKIE